MADGAADSGLRDERNVCRLCGALENLSLCGGCRDTWYCCKDHQRADWKEHKRKCKEKQAPKKDRSDSEKVSAIHTKETAASDSEAKHSVRSSGNEVDALVTVSSESAVDDNVTNSADATGKTQSEKCSPSSSFSSTRKLSNEVKKQGRLPVIAEEGGERYFLDKPFSQTLQTSRHAACVRRSANAMSPRGSSLDSKDAYLDVLKSRFTVIAQYVVKCLYTYGICVIDGFLGEATGLEILAEVKQLQQLGVFRKGQLVHPASNTSDTIRGDIITWVDGRGNVCENIQFLVSCMDAVVQNCSSLMEDYTINERTKAMVACYPGNSTGYVRHVDNPNGDGRCITCIYYLNNNWDVRKDGGLLRIYPEGKDTVANIEPKFDRLLFFWSDRRNPHEVLPSMRERYAITVWYYEAEERAQALKRFKGELSSHPKKQAVPLFNGSEDKSS